MHHFLVDPDQLDRQTGIGRILGRDVHHIQKVLRLSPGSQISVSNGRGNKYLAEIHSMDGEAVMLHLVRELMPESSLSTKPVTLTQGIAKGSKMDWIVQKTTEMGIEAIQPVMTDFTVVRFPSVQEADKKRIRWQKIAAEASKQSKRSYIPEIRMPATFRETVERAKQSGQRRLHLLAHEKQGGSGLHELLHPDRLKEYEGITLWIGPEGGFSAEEVKASGEAGVFTVGLGPRILRTETAGLVLLSIVLYELGELEAK